MGTDTRSAGPRGFVALSLAPALVQAALEAGYREPTPLQTQAIPAILAGCDLLAVAPPGSGRTAAFALPLLHGLMTDQPLRPQPLLRALVLTATPERAARIEQSLRRGAAGSGLRSLAVFGGVGPGPQIESLRRGVDVLVATPGRLLELLGEGAIDLSALRQLVLDDALRLLEAGFLGDLRRIQRALSATRQTLLFCTRPSFEVRALAAAWLRDPLTLDAADDGAPSLARSRHAGRRRSRPDRSTRPA